MVSGCTVLHGTGPARHGMAWHCAALPCTARLQLLGRLDAFEPDAIFISAGFDAHRCDDVNYGLVGSVSST